VEVRRTAGLHLIQTYIKHRVETFLPFIQSQAIYRECQTSRTTQAAARHPVWWAAFPLLPDAATDNVAALPQVHNPAALPDQDHDDKTLPLVAPPPALPHRSPHTIIV